MVSEAAIESYSAIFNAAWLYGMRRKLGLFGEEADDLSLIQSLLEWMQKTGADYTKTFRDLIQEPSPIDEQYQSQAFQQWHDIWNVRLARNSKPIKSSFCLMRNSNPVIIPRNQHVEDALDSAKAGDLAPFNALLEAVQKPFQETESNTRFRTAPPNAAGHYQTFCGT